MKNPALSADLASTLRDRNPALFPTRWAPKRLLGTTENRQGEGRSIHAPSRRQAIRMGISVTARTSWGEERLPGTES